MTEDYHGAFERATDGDRPGEPLHPNGDAVVDSGNHPIRDGAVAVWVEYHHPDLFTDDLARVDLRIVDTDDGDLIGVPPETPVQEADTLFRVRADFHGLQETPVNFEAEYDTDTGKLILTRKVDTRATTEYTLREVRLL